MSCVLEDVSIKNRQGVLQEDINDIKSPIASIASSALQVKNGSKNACCSCTSKVILTDAEEITYAEVQNAVKFIINKVVLQEEEEISSTAEDDLKEILRNNADFCAKLEAMVSKVNNLEGRWSQLDNDIISNSNRINSIEQYGRLYNLILDDVKNVPTRYKGLKFSMYNVRSLNSLLGRHQYRPV